MAKWLDETGADCVGTSTAARRACQPARDLGPLALCLIVQSSAPRAEAAAWSSVFLVCMCAAYYAASDVAYGFGDLAFRRICALLPLTAEPLLGLGPSMWMIWAAALP